MIKAELSATLLQCRMILQKSF